VNIVGDVLDLRVVLALARHRRGGALEGSHGGERGSSDKACSCGGRGCGSEGNWPHCSAREGGSLSERSRRGAAQVATEGRHSQLASVEPGQCRGSSREEKGESYVCLQNLRPWGNKRELESGALFGWDD
jgi:hypothetical protein